MSDPPRPKRTRPVVRYEGKVDPSGAPDPSAPGGAGRSRPVVFFVVFLVLAVMGWFLIQNLGEASRQQDCLMAGRKNCAPIDTSNVK